MKNIKKLMLIVNLFCIISLISINAYAATTSIVSVKQHASPINFSEGTLTKKITDIQNNEVTIELRTSINNNKVLDSNTEIIFLLDDSSSMATVLEDGTTTRKNKVIDSTKELIKKVNINNPNVKMAVIAFGGSNKVVQDFTSDRQLLVNSCENLKSQSDLGGTMIGSALKFSKEKFSSETKNKIIVLLTDGIPGDESATKIQLNDENVYIISTLVGLESTDESKIKEIFGTQQNPTADRLYNIEDNEIETTISNNIYNRILQDFQSTVSNVTIKDYFPEEIKNNFDITIKDGSKGNFKIENDTITWQIPNLSISETATLTYTIKLKDNYDSNILEKVLNTNQKVDLNFNNMQGISENKVMTDSPQIKITTEAISNNGLIKESENGSSNDINIKNNSKDNTIIDKNIPKTGVSNVILIALIVSIIYLGLVIAKRNK